MRGKVRVGRLPGSTLARNARGVPCARNQAAPSGAIPSEHGLGRDATDLDSAKASPFRGSSGGWLMSEARPFVHPGTDDDLPGVEPETFGHLVSQNCSSGTTARSYARSSA